MQGIEPALLHSKELFVFRQITPTSPVLGIHCLTAVAALARTRGRPRERVPLAPLGSSHLLCGSPSSWVLNATLCPPRWPDTAPITEVIWSGLPQFNLWLTPKETSALWNSYCWEAALKTLKMGGGVLAQHSWGLNLITDRIVTFQQNMENAIDIICKSDVSAMIWEGKGWPMWAIYFNDITIICYGV